MSLLTILRDNREQKGWEFDDVDATVEDVTIRTGDYTLAEFCEYDEKNDTYVPKYSIERKGGQDLVGSLTSGRDRFLDEIKRASDWDSELTVLIEEPKTTYKRQQKFMRHRDVSPAQIFGTVEKWEEYYNVDFRFVGTRERAQQIVFDMFRTRLQGMLL